MPVNMILNSYFRSGSTAVWHELKKLVGESSVVLYEPCHELLPKLIELERGKTNTLHGKPLWEGYEKISHLELINKHPSLGCAYSYDSGKISDYVAYIGGKYESVILQTNRWHLHLSSLSVDFPEAEIYQLIRNPFDVFSSIKREFYKNDRFPVNKLKELAFYFLGGRAFYINRGFHHLWNISHTGSSNANYRHRLKGGVNPFERFVFTWVVFNYHALSNMKVKAVVYENLCSSEHYMLSSFSNINFAKFYSSELFSRREGFVTYDELRSLEEISAKYGVKDKLQAILDRDDIKPFVLNG